MGAQRKYVSMQAVADYAGVSKATVSKVLNQRRDVSAAARSKVHAACAKLGYRLNPSVQDLLKKGKSGHAQNIAFVLGDVEFANPSYAGMIDGISQGAQAHRLHLILTKLNGNETSLYGLPPAIRDERVAGILISGKLNKSLIELIDETGLPFIVLGNYPKEVTAYSGSVSVDIESLMFQAVRELKKRGRRRIAFFYEDPDNFFAKDCYASFVYAMETHGLPVSRDRVFQGASGDFNALTVMNSGLARKPIPFDSIICLNYLASREIACELIVRAGREIAGEIILATVIDHEQNLPLPTLRFEKTAFKLGRIGLDLLVEKLKNPDLENKHVSFTPGIRLLNMR